MATVLLADTDPEIEDIIHEVEVMCHDAEIGLIVHYEGEDLDEILDSLDAKVIAFSPKGKLTLDEMAAKYKDEEVLLVVGGFLEGDFKSPVYKHANDTVSLGPELLEIPAVIEKIIEAHVNKE